MQTVILNTRAIFAASVNCCTQITNTLTRKKLCVYIHCAGKLNKYVGGNCEGVRESERCNLTEK